MLTARGMAFDATYGEHKRMVEKARATYDHYYRKMGDYAISHGQGNVRPTELRQMPEYRAMFADIDAAYEALQRAQDAAIADHCAHRFGNWGDKFEWYSERDARKWRRQAKGK